MREAAGSRAAFVVAGVLAAVVGPGAPPAAAGSAGVSVEGRVYHDRDNDGRRAADEPGLPGLRLQEPSTGASAVTDAAGRYRIDGLPRAGRLVLHTGWLRSQCFAADVLDCPAGPGPDNGFPVRNQLLELPLDPAPAGPVDVGLLPDWPGRTTTPPAAGEPAAGAPADPVDRVDPAGGADRVGPVDRVDRVGEAAAGVWRVGPRRGNVRDVAARLSADAGPCGSAPLAVCRLGEEYVQAGQVFNQGTAPLTGVRAKLAVAPGDCLRGVSLVAGATSEGVTGLTVRPAAWTCATREVEVALAGTLRPAGAARLRIVGAVAAGPGTPGCHATAPERAGVGPDCPTAAPQGRAATLGVSHLDPAGPGEPPATAPADDEGPLCAATRPVVECPTGLHDKRRQPDEVDPAGHNVDAALAPADRVNLAMRLAALPADPDHPGAVVLRGWAVNRLDPAAATGLVPAGATIRFAFPPGTAVRALPAPHVLARCTPPHPATAPARPAAFPPDPASSSTRPVTAPTERGAPTGRGSPTGRGAARAGVVVDCVLGGPLAPDAAGLALDLVVRPPGTPRSGAGQPRGGAAFAVACVAPPAAAPPETVPADPGGCDAGTLPAATPTDNDAALPITHRS
ncbi:hypothetical protein [Pilimelia anulata]|uniref:hypothetical protein n=1 Tax=Pilimelia anulata TaxID=53371 RepID=UPI00166542F3|nr:hypothetical protein [Pilimelia anulata]